MQTVVLIVMIGGVVLLIALGIRARLAVRTPSSSTRKRFVIWVPLAALVLVYVVADAVTAAHHWFGAASMLLLLCVSTYDLITRNP
ncbi:hypothetical protein [Mycolicibacterium llatzerense]|uniref:hypothetical protein n=1 Tax=Mycolicibacterium llatzerense TaxID=280871 RepID=UPI0031DB6544